ncbi:MAG: translocation/assembly module TamB domain-containing protein [Labilithrix sp.]|nr:translocation/assembly module TamB domain-containing protein [Labilithrix sp.]MCW5818091.1 translocation/assembly module TamB domain-containing protein [Labilithrix sp.]
MDRSSSTQLPPLPRSSRRRDWVRVVCRFLCAVFAVAGFLPIALGVAVRTEWARSLATRETRKIVKDLGIEARYELDLRLWPLSVTLTNIHVDASDGGTPFLTATRATARPKIFGLLAGKLVIDQIEVLEPKARVVMKDGKLQNLKLDLPEGPKSDKRSRAPFSVVSTTEAFVDFTFDDKHVVATHIDADVTVDEDEAGDDAFEVALRVDEARTKVVRGGAVDDDTLCKLDGRARIEQKKVLVRRLELHGAADMDPAPGTHLGCELPKTDYRVVELALGHFAVTMPPGQDYPNLEGHVKVRAPLPLIGRKGPDAPLTEGWAGVDAEIRFTPETAIPDLAGKIEVHGVRVERFIFGDVSSEVAVRRGVITAPLTKLNLAESQTEIRDIEVRPLSDGIPIKVGSISVRNANFTSLLRDFHVHPRPFVGWDIREVDVSKVEGTADPLHLDGEIKGHTYNFAVYDRPAKETATRERIIGVPDAALAGKLAIRPKGFSFENMTVTTPRSVAQNTTVMIGYHEELLVDVPSSRIDLAEMSPLGDLVMSGVAEPKVHISGTAGAPMLKGETSVKDFVMADIPFGNVTQGTIEADIANVKVDLSDVRATKGKSTYELSTGRLDFSKPAKMRMEAQVSSKSLNVRDFFSMFHLEDDPRLLELDGTLETNARMRLVLGGPEDKCQSGFLTVTAQTTGRDLNVLGEHFDEGHADMEYRWEDRLAGLEGAEIDVHSMSLTKVKKAGGTPVGSVLGSVAIHRGGAIRGSVVVQGFPLARTNVMGPAARYLEGSGSGVARIGGTISSFEVTADASLSPMRIFGAPFGSSDVHLTMTQVPRPSKVKGKTKCGADIYAELDKEAYGRDTSSQGEFRISGGLFGNQVRLDDVVVTRQKAPLITGNVRFEDFDLDPIGRIVVARTPDETDDATPLGGRLSGALALKRVATDDLPHADVTFTPAELRVDRGGQRLELHDKQAVFTLANDTVTIPKVTFDLAAPNGLKGAVAVNGKIDRVTRGGALDLEAVLSPIDLGILVGVVPKMTRGIGTLTGSVKVKGTPKEPALDGRLAIRGGEFAFRGLPGGISDVNVDIEADENEVRITHARGHFLGGDVGMTGRLPIKDGNLGIARAEVTGRQLYFTPVEGVRGVVDADLELSLNSNAPSAQGRLPFVGGSVTITQFEYTRPVALDLTGFRGGAKRTVVEAYDPSQDSVVFGFDVRARSPLRIRNNLVDAQLAIDQRGLHVSGTNQRLGLRGELAAVQGGRFRVFANDFEVRKATIRFDDPTRIVPRVDITGVTEYRRYSNTTGPGAGGAAAGGGSGSISSGGSGSGLWRITLHAYGDTEDLHVDMTSDPALSREDIFFLLTIGLTRAEVDQVRAGSVYASAAFEAIGTVSGADRALKTVIPVIDDFRFGSAYSPRTGRTEPQVTLGRRLTESLRANVSTGLTEDRQLRSNVEWRLSRPLSVQTSYDNISTVSSGSVGNFGLDFRWRIEFN